jgi:hypothetical protein
MPPPYVVAVRHARRGPRLTTNLVGSEPAIGERVSVAWREREGLPPLPVFQRLAGAGGGHNDEQSASQTGAG